MKAVLVVSLIFLLYIWSPYDLSILIIETFVEQMETAIKRESSNWERAEGGRGSVCVGK